MFPQPVVVVPSAWVGGKEHLRHLSDVETIVKDELTPLLFRPSYKAKTKQALKLHIKSDHDKISYSCDQCNSKDHKKFGILVINVNTRQQ